MLLANESLPRSIRKLRCRWCGGSCLSSKQTFTSALFFFILSVEKFKFQTCNRSWQSLGPFDFPRGSIYTLSLHPTAQMQLEFVHGESRIWVGYLFHSEISTPNPCSVLLSVRNIESSWATHGFDLFSWTWLVVEGPE